MNIIIYSKYTIGVQEVLKSSLDNRLINGYIIILRYYLTIYIMNVQIY